MRLSDGTKFRWGTPKYSRLTTQLYGAGGMFGIFSWFVAAPAKDWLGGIGILSMAGGAVVYLAGMIAERKEWEAAHKIATK